MKDIKCQNQECQKRITYGDTLYVLPYRDLVYCSPECFATSMGLYPIVKDDPEYPDVYDEWWVDEESGC